MLNKVVLRIEVKEEIRLEGNINSSEKLAKVFKNEIGNNDRETLALICFNSSNQPMNYHEVSVGTLNTAPFHPREILKIAIMSNAAAIAISHNHPSGNVYASSPDLLMTQQLSLCCELMEIKFLDHIIVNPIDDAFFSFQEEVPNLFETTMEDVGIKL